MVIIIIIIIIIVVIIIIIIIILVPASTKHADKKLNINKTFNDCSGLLSRCSYRMCGKMTGHCPSGWPWKSARKGASSHFDHL